MRAPSTVMSSSLAIHGGSPVRTRPLPARRQCDEAVLDAVRRVFEHSWATDRDFGYQGVFEEAYTQAFCHMQGGGYADAVSSGTAAVYLAVAALDLPRGAHIACSPVTDPGSMGALVQLGLVPVLADAAPGGFNVSAQSLERVLHPGVRAVLITHTGGLPVDMGPIMELARAHGLPVVEDASQAHQATMHGVPVGCFGHVAAFSTMFSKNHSTGGCGGVVYTRDEALYWRIRALADRGKPFGQPDFDEKQASQFLFPAMNFEQNEVACAMGEVTLSRLPAVNARRRAIVERIARGIASSDALYPLLPPAGGVMAPFFLTLHMRPAWQGLSARAFGLAVRAEGFGINPRYDYVAADWPWLHPYCASSPSTPEASRTRDSSFNVLFHEQWLDEDVDELLTALHKVEMDSSSRGKG